MARPLRSDALFEFEVVALVAFVLLSLVIIGPIDVGVAVTGTIALVATRMVNARGPASATPIAFLALGIAAFLTLGAGAAGHGGGTVTSTAVLLAPLVLVLAYLVIRSDWQQAVTRWLGAITLLVVVGMIGVIWISVLDRPEIDVIDLHVSAADTLLDGGNPYAEATAVDTSPIAESGSEIVGYPYPPLTLVLYAAATWLFGDPRWAGVIAIAAALLLITRPWINFGSRATAAVVALGLAIVLQPSLGHILRQGWTEPLALPFLVGAGLLWRRNPAGAAVLLGLTFGLKQYWIVAIPLLLVWNDEFRLRRVLIACGVAGASLLPAFLADPGAAWGAMVEFHLNVHPRLDSIGLAGLGWNAPLWLMLALASAVAMVMGSRPGFGDRFLIALCATMATSFLFGSQAFVNYWFLIGSMAVIAVAVSVTDQHRTKSSAAVVPAAGSAAS